MNLPKSNTCSNTSHAKYPWLVYKHNQPLEFDVNLDSKTESIFNIHVNSFVNMTDNVPSIQCAALIVRIINDISNTIILILRKECLRWHHVEIPFWVVNSCEKELVVTLDVSISMLWSSSVPFRKATSLTYSNFFFMNRREDHHTYTALVSLMQKIQGQKSVTHHPGPVSCSIIEFSLI